MRLLLKLSVWLYNNSLSILFFSLFVLALAGQSVSGFFSYNERLSAHGLPHIGYAGYLSTGDFLDGIFTNWQAAILQLVTLILFGGLLHQKGAPHSRQPEGDSPAKRRREGEGTSWLHRHSLSVAFALYFAGSFAAHVVFGCWAYNETRALTAQPPVSVGAYLLTAAFWNKNCQTWQAEFIVMGLFLVSTIFLRDQSSAESKPLRSADEETGEHNK
jgi:hypothetical protein